MVVIGWLPTKTPGRQNSKSDAAGQRARDSRARQQKLEVSFTQPVSLFAPSVRFGQRYRQTKPSTTHHRYGDKRFFPDFIHSPAFLLFS